VVPAGPTVVYEVTATGSGALVDITYTDQDGDIIQLGGVALPWRLSLVRVGSRWPTVLSAHPHGFGDTGPLSCSITVNGKVLSTMTTNERPTMAYCSALQL
jgi:hypothetical protein